MKPYPLCAAFVAALTTSAVPSDRDFARRVDAIAQRDQILEYITDVMTRNRQGSREWRNAQMVWQLIGGRAAAW